MLRKSHYFNFQSCKHLWRSCCQLQAKMYFFNSASQNMKYTKWISLMEAKTSIYLLVFEFSYLYEKSEQPVVLQEPSLNRAFNNLFHIWRGGCNSIYRKNSYNKYMFIMHLHAWDCEGKSHIIMILLYFWNYLLSAYHQTSHWKRVFLALRCLGWDSSLLWSKPEYLIVLYHIHTGLQKLGASAHWTYGE